MMTVNNHVRLYFHVINNIGKGAGLNIEVMNVPAMSDIPRPECPSPQRHAPKIFKNSTSSRNQLQRRIYFPVTHVPVYRQVIIPLPG
ncbi:MAG: hypothetical protein U0289_10195 [Cyclobacteriaceae bacterium]